MSKAREIRIAFEMLRQEQGTPDAYEHEIASLAQCSEGEVNRVLERDPTCSSQHPHGAPSPIWFKETYR